MNEGRRYQTFEEFWPYYVSEHASEWTRALHFAGTTIAGLCLASAIAARRPSLILGALVGGYGPAWVSHFFIEKNRPATFTYPTWSLLADLRMWSLIAQGKMQAEVDRVLSDRDLAGREAARDAANDGAPRDAAPRSEGEPVDRSVLN